MAAVSDTSDNKTQTLVERIASLIAEIVPPLVRNDHGFKIVVNVAPAGREANIEAPTRYRIVID